MSQFRSIAVGVDFSEASACAARQAARIAAETGAKLCRIHGVEPSIPEDLADACGTSLEAVRGSCLEAARARLRAFAEDVELTPAVRFEVRLGIPLEQIQRLVAAVKADLLVLGSTGSTGHVVGTLASQCVRSVPGAVLLVAPDFEGPFRNLLACADFSSNSQPAIDLAAEFAHFEQGSLELLHVLRPPWRHMLAVPAASEKDRYRARRIERLEVLRSSVLRHSPGLEVTGVVEDHQSIGYGILEHARAQAADLIVMGTGMLTSARYRVLGTTAERVLGLLHCSLLAVSPAGVPVTVADAGGA